MIARVVISMLLNAVWMPILIAAAAYAVLKFARNSSAATRYGVLTVALFAALVLPVVTALWTYRTGPAPQTSATKIVSSPIDDKRIALPPVNLEKLPAATTVEPAATPQFHVAIPQRIAAGIAIVWGLFAFALLLRLAISFAYLERLKRDALPLPMEYRGDLRRFSEKRPGANVRLCVSDETVVPVAVGWFDAMVLIPRHLIDELDPSDLDRIVLHEIAHLRRGDSFVNALQQAGSALFFFSPGLAWLCRQLDIEREVACDDWVVERGAEAAPYASCLLRLAERTPWPHKALAAPGAFITRKSMSIRIERILHKTRNVRLRPAPGPLAAAFVTVAGIAAAGFWLSPSIAYPLQPETSATKVRVASKVYVRQSPHVRVREVNTATTRVTNAGPQQLRAQPEVKVRELPKHKAIAKPKAQNHATPLPLSTPFTVAAATAAPSSGDDYIQSMRRTFGRDLSVEELIQLKSIGVTPDLVQQLRQAGFTDVSPRQAVEARAMGLTPARIDELHATWGPQLRFEDMITLTAMRIDRAYANGMESAGLHGLRPQQLVELKSVGVTADYIRQADAMGFGTLNAHQLVEMKSLGIDGAYVQRVRDHGFKDLTLQQLVQLKASGLIK